MRNCALQEQLMKWPPHSSPIEQPIPPAYDDIEKTMKYNKVGDKVNIRVNRNGKEMTIPVQLRKSL